MPGEKYQFVLKWGPSIPNHGAFNNPHAVAIDASGNAYVVDTGHNRVLKFELTAISFWNGAWQFQSPQGIAVDRTVFRETYMLLIPEIIVSRNSQSPAPP